ncbi:hypothetical protein [Symbiopectobacterium sp. RP]|uniref:hypothetical protein n=1 Tax=Symbiopectobacterium sp. RP TaxID=3248553 RepID=UPI003D277D8E
MITANALICGKKIQLIVIKIMSLGYNAHIGYDRMYFDDPATGPDVGSAEWVYCHDHGGCQ